MDKRFLGILGALIIVFVGIFVISQNSGGKSGSNNGSNSAGTHHVYGDGKTGITFQEYGDYQCPVCEAYFLPVKQAVEQYRSDIYFQFSNLPLSPQPHPNAFAGARAAEAAGMQNKYWEMHDKLYEQQNEWANASNPQTFYNTYAQQLGLDVNKFKQDYASTAVNDAINADLDAFDKTGKEKSTPSFFLNGEYVTNTVLVDPQTGRPSADSIGKFIKSEIDKKSAQSK